jgi:predicted kinase
MEPAHKSPPIVLVDGRSGAGKTEYSEVLARELEATLISLDDVYPGWDGLDAGSAHVFSRVMIPFSSGRPGLYTTWDWAAQRPGGKVVIDPLRPLIVEGCGAIRRESVVLATRSVWMDASEETRKARALARDGDLLRPHWTRWALQEERFLAIHDSAQLANDILSGE